MSKGPFHRMTTLFQTGSLAGVAAGVLMPYQSAFCASLVCVCLLWFAGCLLGRALRREFAAARKYLAFAILLVALNAFLQNDALQSILLLAIVMLLYFAAALQCGGIAALAERLAPGERARKLPGAVSRFEYAMAGFAVARLIGISAASLAFLCDLAGMAAMVIGFFTLWNYFGEVRK